MRVQPFRRVGILLSFTIFAVSLVTSRSIAQTRPATVPADDRQQVIRQVRAFIRAARALDEKALTALYAVPKTPEAKQALADSIHFTIVIERLRLVAEKKLGPEPEEENDDWNWGIIPEARFDAALEREPQMVEIQGDHATAFMADELQRQPDGRWLLSVPLDIPRPDERKNYAKLRTVLDAEAARILADIEAGRLTKPSDVSARLAGVMGS